MSQAPSTLGSMTTSSLWPTAGTISHEVVERPGRVQAVDARPQAGLAEIGRLGHVDEAAAGGLLGVGRDGVFEIAEHHVDLGGDVAGTLARIFSTWGGMKWIIRSSGPAARGAVAARRWPAADRMGAVLSFYEKAIYNYCLRILKNSDNAKDITQETFIKVYTHRKLIDPEKNIKTWIFTIATNTTYDFLRGKKRKNETSLEEKIETISCFESYYPQEGLVSDVNKALEQIKIEYKNSLLLFYQQGFQYQEIADILCVPLNTVKTHISRGKEQLKDELKNYGKN